MSVIAEVEIVSESESVLSVQFNLSHMADIEDAHTLSHGYMLVDNARVLNRHIEPVERNHLPAEREMVAV